MITLYLQKVDLQYTSNTIFHQFLFINSYQLKKILINIPLLILIHSIKNNQKFYDYINFNKNNFKQKFSFENHPINCDLIYC